eukprot:366292-Chlamydomonas_euryale.AAC.2
MAPHPVPLHTSQAHLAHRLAQQLLTAVPLARLHEPPPPQAVHHVVLGDAAVKVQQRVQAARLIGEDDDV